MTRRLRVAAITAIHFTELEWAPANELPESELSQTCAPC
jgi:hypothetical protein